MLELLLMLICDPSLCCSVLDVGRMGDTLCYVFGE
jgi:hypothetical protein